MKTPEKIYFNPLLMKDGESIVRRCTFERQRDSQIEYIRTDAFIEKACNKLAQLMYDQHLFEGRLHQDAIIENFVGDFRKYMKGE